MEPQETKVWRKSSYSGGTGECVEVAAVSKPVRRTAVRDSKSPHGPVLVVDRSGWSTLANEIKAGEHDL